MDSFEWRISRASTIRMLISHRTSTFGNFLLHMPVDDYGHDDSLAGAGYQFALSR